MNTDPIEIKKGTIKGVSAALIWSTAAPVVAFITDVHPFLYAGFLHSIAFLTFCVIWVFLRENPLSKLKNIPLWFYVCAFFGVCFQSLMWPAAVQNAPPLEAVLVIYIWPIMVVVFTAISLKTKLYWFHYLACVLGFLGVFVLMLGKGLNLSSFSVQSGHLYALTSATLWSIYSAIAARQKHLSAYIYAPVYLFSGVVNLGIWGYGLGAPQASDFSLTLLGVFAVFNTFAYILWDIGIKRGDNTVIGVFSFLIPILGTFFVVLIGKDTYTADFVIALILVMTSIFIVKFGPNLFKKKISR